MLKDLTNGRLEEAKVYAKNHNDESLQKCLDSLQRVDENSGCETSIVTDFAPLSFEFARFKNGKRVMNGGIIFHGQHDGFGSGAAPTLSVTITPTSGWQIHT